MVLFVCSGEFVDRQMCRDAILPMPALCEVPCSKDCVLSPWTSWSLCSHTCSGKNTEGKQTRSRSILAYNAGDGGCHFESFCYLFTLSLSLLHSYLVFGWLAPQATRTASELLGRDLTCLSNSTGVMNAVLLKHIPSTGVLMMEVESTV